MASANRNSVSISSEVKIFYSIRKLLWQLITSTIVTLVGVFTVYGDLKFYIGYIVIIAGIYLMYVCLSKVSSRLPIFIINEKGITSRGYGYFEWEVIEKVYVERRRKWRQFNDYLVFITDHTYEILLDDLDVSFEKLEQHIEVYRTRYKKGL